MMLLKKVTSYIERHRLIEKGDRVLVAFSGGPDSLCLLHLLRSLQESHRLYLAVAHLDHRIRPDAAVEAEKARRLAAAWQLPFEGAAVDAASFRRERKLSASEASRVVRYRFLLQAAQKQKTPKIALGHQLDDQAETVLFNLLRGTGPDGLAGILPRRSLGPVELIRPLLGITRGEIERYCREQGLDPVIDSSNLQAVYTRNRIRLELIPHLEERYNPRLKRSLARLAALAAEDRDYLNRAALEQFKQLASRKGGALLIDGAAFTALPKALRGRVARLALQEYIPAKKIGRRQIKQLLHLAEGEGPARQITYPAGARAYRSYGRLILLQAEASAKSSFAPRPLQVPGYTALADGGPVVEAALRLPEKLTWPPAAQQAYLDYDALPSPLQLRTRWPGARFYPQGAPGNKKLKDFMIDQKVPRRHRDSLPLVVAGSEVIWVAGKRIAHPYRVTEKTVQVLVLTLHRPTKT